MYEITATNTKGIGIHILGLPDIETKHILLKVATAIERCGFHLPGTKLVIEARPLDDFPRDILSCRHEVFQSLELAIAVCTLIATRQIRPITWANDGKDILFFASLGLDGSLHLPFCGHNHEFSEAVVAETLDWMQHAFFDEIIGYPTSAENTRIYTAAENLSEICTAINDGVL